MFLKHCIKNSNAGPNAEWKLMLMDNHDSHSSAEFLRLANENYIRPYKLIPHLTHYMQPLDVGVFHPYKHWHDVAIKDSLARLDVDYSIVSFLRDLKWIRNKTFTQKTIKSAWKKSGMWKPSTKRCLANLKTFSASEKTPEPTLPVLPKHLKNPST